MLVNNISVVLFRMLGLDDVWTILYMDGILWRWRAV